MPEQRTSSGEGAGERECPLCGAALEGVGVSESGEFRCARCRSTARFDGESLLAIEIPGYHRRLVELEAANRQLVREIEEEGRKGPARDARTLRKKHLERQDVLCEYGFLSHFREYVDKW